MILRLNRNMTVGQSLIKGGAILALIICGCAAPKKKPEERTYRIATRQHAPEPVYRPLKWVRSPDPSPSRDIEGSRAALILPVIQYEVDQLPMSEAALILGASANYTTFCVSSVADEIVTLKELGTLDELAQKLAEQSGSRAVIDHENRELRFLLGEDGAS